MSEGERVAFPEKKDLKRPWDWFPMGDRGLVRQNVEEKKDRQSSCFI